ncbi:MAG: tRNA 2-thiouridine(34) synthase MnmA [Actinomycetota bacterium]|jgi:tRNA-specific 2-thiouridylase|nr:tRNA 2-thiouridine(34) synthase MnmA [Actinomycetota bacterium]
MSHTYVAMSGGVDSSLAAALCVEAGQEVTGVTMQLFSSTQRPELCGGLAAIDDARKVCDSLGIQHVVLDMSDVFERDVIAPFVDAYAEGRTPNPCIACNDRVKFGDLLARVIAMGADELVTGHYAKVVRDAADEYWLERGVDDSKDQSYFLYRLRAEALRHIRFPLGEMTKKQVRKAASVRALPTAHRSESQEICFVPDGGVGEFVVGRKTVAGLPGAVVDANGAHIGTHEGVARYTIGQRKGLGIAGHGRRYVTAIDADRNEVVLGQHHDLAVSRVIARDVLWRGGEKERVSVQVRYRSRPVAGEAHIARGELHVDLDEQIFGVARGQAVVCYQGERVLGGGVVFGTE